MNIFKYTRYTQTTKFILPLLFDNNRDYHETFQNLFLNAFIADITNKETDDKIHLVFADYPSLKYQQTLPKSVSEYKHKDRYVLVYSLADKWQEDYEKIIRSEYSTLSENAKNRIFSFWDYKFEKEREIQSFLIPKEILGLT